MPDDAVLVSVEGFLLEVAEESWVELSCLVLSDAARKIQLTTYTQSTPVDPAFVAAAKSATPGRHISMRRKINIKSISRNVRLSRPTTILRI